MVVTVLVVYFYGPGLTGSFGSLPLPRIMREYCTADRQPRNQNSKLQVWLLLSAYHFHIIVKSKYQESNHHKLGTVCMLESQESRPSCWRSRGLVVCKSSPGLSNAQPRLETTAPEDPHFINRSRSHIPHHLGPSLKCLYWIILGLYAEFEQLEDMWLELW